MKLVPVLFVAAAAVLLFFLPAVPAEIYTWGYSGGGNGGYHGYGYTEDSADFEHFPNNPLNISATKISIGGRGFWEVRNGEDTATFSSGAFALFLTGSSFQTSLLTAWSEVHANFFLLRPYFFADRRRVLSLLSFLS